MCVTQVQPFDECQLQFKGKLQYSFCQVSAWCSTYRKQASWAAYDSNFFVHPVLHVCKIHLRHDCIPAPFIVSGGPWQVQQYLICQGMWQSLLFPNYGAAWKSRSCTKTICWSCVTLPLRARATCVSHSSVNVWSLCEMHVLSSHTVHDRACLYLLQ